MNTPARVRQRTRTRTETGTISTNRRTRVNGEVTEHEGPPRQIEQTVNGPEVGYVQVGGKLTKNMGDYNSATISVSVTLPSAPDDASIRATKARAAALVDEFMDEEYKAAIDDSTDEDDD